MWEVINCVISTTKDYEISWLDNIIYAILHHHENHVNEPDTCAIYKVLKLDYVPSYPSLVEQIKQYK